MTEPKPDPKKGALKDRLKIAGGVLLVCVAIVVFYKRMPSTKYAEVHADKPRARPAVEAPAPTPVAVRAAPKAAAPQPPKIAPSAPEAAPPPPAEPTATQPVVRLTDACAAEAGILCYEVPEEQLPRCLGRYDDVLMKDCRSALEALRK
jgi:hypothetical protein